MEKGVTLIELLIVAVILIFVIGGMFSIERFATQQIRGVDEKLEVIDKFAVIIQHMERMVLNAQGTPTDVGIQASGDMQTLFIRFDPNIFVDGADPTSTFADDNWCAYELNGNQMLFYPQLCAGPCPVNPGAVAGSSIVLAIEVDTFQADVVNFLAEGTIIVTLGRTIVSTGEIVELRTRLAALAHSF